MIRLPTSGWLIAYIDGPACCACMSVAALPCRHHVDKSSALHAEGSMQMCLLAASAGQWSACREDLRRRTGHTKWSDPSILACQARDNKQTTSIADR